MKRGTRPFIVEVRRGQKRTSAIEGDEEASPLRNEALRRAEVALFGTPPAERPEAKPETLPPPKPRRILASLTEPEPEPVAVVEPERRRGRRPGVVQKPVEAEPHRKGRITDKAARSVPLTPEVVSAALDKIEKATLAVPWRGGAKPSSISGLSAQDAAGAEKTLRMRRKKAATSSRRAEGKSKRQPAGAPPVAIAARPVVAAKRQQRPTQPAPTETSTPKRPSIRGRYVFGTELKPGERWKRRLRHSR